MQLFDIVHNLGFGLDRRLRLRVGIDFENVCLYQGKQQFRSCNGLIDSLEIGKTSETRTLKNNERTSILCQR